MYSTKSSGKRGLSLIKRQNSYRTGLHKLSFTRISYTFNLANMINQREPSIIYLREMTATVPLETTRSRQFCIREI